VIAAGPSSEVPAKRLFPLDRLEQRLEVPLAEAARAVPLDHLEEQRRPVLERLREDLEQVAVVVAVGQDPQAPQVGDVLLDLTDAAGQVLVVRVGRLEEADAALAERLDGVDDALRGQGDVLNAGPAVELQVLLDLALAPPLGGLV